MEKANMNMTAAAAQTAQATVQVISAAVDTKIELINQKSDHLKAVMNRTFFETGTLMSEIKDELQAGGMAVSEIYEYITERTDYKVTGIKQLIGASIAIENLRKSQCDYLPEKESVVRYLACAALNKDPETQARLWEELIEEHGLENITGTMVQEKVRMWRDGPLEIEDEATLLRRKVERLEKQLKQAQEEAAEAEEENEQILNGELDLLEDERSDIECGWSELGDALEELETEREELEDLKTKLQEDYHEMKAAAKKEFEQEYDDKIAMFKEKLEDMDTYEEMIRRKGAEFMLKAAGQIDKDLPGKIIAEFARMAEAAVAAVRE